MIHKIEVWDFECHEHSVLDNLSPGLNLIFGESDAGKTSFIRALKLASYNEFDPRSVRTGKKNCKVYVETERGWVKVTRGKDNTWETCRRGEASRVFSKIGTNILPEAAEIIGLNVVELGDMQLPVNIMDQGEGHFMLNELAGDSASGSMRAQIVDEISGLSGIEGLIKEVSLDRHRYGRAVKENEDKAKELRESMHDEDELDAEEKLLAQVQVLVSEHDRLQQSVELMALLFEGHHEASRQVAETQVKLKQLPNTKILKAILGKANKALTQVSNIQPLWEAHKEEGLLLAQASDKMNKLADPTAINKELQKANKAMARSKELNSLSMEHFYSEEEVSQRQQQLDDMPDLDEIQKAILEAKTLIQKAQKTRERAEEIADALEELDESVEKVDIATEKLADAVKERNEALADVDVCPLTQKPLSAECIKLIGEVE